MRATMIAFVAAGLLGVALHYLGSVGFQKEADPSMRGFPMFVKAMQSKAPPVLAPAIMLQFGFIGLIVTYLKKDKGGKV